VSCNCLSHSSLPCPDQLYRTDEAMFESHLHVNTRGTFWSVQAAARQMVAQGRGGSIIGVASISALLGGKQQVHYTPTKASVLSMMQSAACALAEHKIRCNALLPGHTRTPMSANDLARPDKLKAVNERIPLGHVAEPHDMAGPAVFLASDMSSYVASLCLAPPSTSADMSTDWCPTSCRWWTIRQFAMSSMIPSVNCCFVGIITVAIDLSMRCRPRFALTQRIFTTFGLC